jgi:hypothetical protein
VRRAGLCVLALLPLLLCNGSADAVSSTAVPGWTLVGATGRGLDLLTSERPRLHVLLRHRRGSHFADFRPVLSPDGRRVAFYRRARSPARTGLWVLSLRGGTPRQLGVASSTTSTGRPTAPRSPSAGAGPSGEAGSSSSTATAGPFDEYSRLEAFRAGRLTALGFFAAAGRGSPSGFSTRTEVARGGSLARSASGPAHRGLRMDG